MAGGWESLGLLPELLQRILPGDDDDDCLGWNLPTAIQEEVIPLLLGGADVLAAAETGSGKTAAFALPLLQLCAEAKLSSIFSSSSSAIPSSIRPSPGPGIKPSPRAELDSTPKQPVKVVMLGLSILDRDAHLAVLDPTAAAALNAARPEPQKLSGEMWRIQSKVDPNEWAGIRATMGIALPPSPPPSSSSSSSSKENSHQSISPDIPEPPCCTYVFGCTVMDSCIPTDAAAAQGTVRLGWSTSDASLWLGTDAGGYGYGGSGVKVHQGRYDPYPAGRQKEGSFGPGDQVTSHLTVFPCHKLGPTPSSTTREASTTSHAQGTTNHNNNNADRSKKPKSAAAMNAPVVATISFAKNGQPLGEAFALTTLDVAQLGSPPALFPTLCLKNAECAVWFGGSDQDQHDRSSKQGNDDDDDRIFSWDWAVAQGHVTMSRVDASHLVWNPLEATRLQATAVPTSLSSSSSSRHTNVSSHRNLTPTRSGPRAMVLEPTRDLAEQTYRSFVMLSKYMTHPLINLALLVGGVDNKKTLRRLQDDQVDILVGTPPIMASYMKKGIISPTNCRLLILDEADELVGADSIQHIRAIYSRLVAVTDPLVVPTSHGWHQDDAPQGQPTSPMDRLQVGFFSATLHSKPVRDLADMICHRPIWVDLKGKTEGIFPETVHHCVVHVDPSHFQVGVDANVTTDAVHRRGQLNAAVVWDTLEDREVQSEKIKQLKFRAVKGVIDAFAMEQVLIFCRTNLDCDLMEKYLHSLGRGDRVVDKYTCCVLAGMRSMQERQKSLQDFKAGEVRILICTDVAARGIDIQELPFVINMTLPDKSETYVHRCGRVGRADRMGLAISLVSAVNERVWFCQKGTKPPCSDTRDYERGGNCIWYNEPKLWADLVKLLTQNGVAFYAMKYPNLTLPPEIQSILTRGGYGCVASGTTTSLDLLSKLNSLRGKAIRVQETEFALQASFWLMRKQASLES